jgi:hypothetical protein
VNIRCLWKIAVGRDSIISEFPARIEPESSRNGDPSVRATCDLVRERRLNGDACGDGPSEAGTLKTQASGRAGAGALAVGEDAASCFSGVPLVAAASPDLCVSRGAEEPGKHSTRRIE